MSKFTNKTIEDFINIIGETKTLSDLLDKCTTPSEKGFIYEEVSRICCIAQIIQNNGVYTEKSNSLKKINVDKY